MSIKQDYINNFMQKELKNFNAGPYGDGETIKRAIAKAYMDMQPRTIKGHGKFDAPDNKSANWFLERFAVFFKKPKTSQDVFDSWMDKVCSDFIQYYNVTFNTDIKFGKAQKIFNMTFKYLYCFWGEERPDAFRFCHMPLDSYILNWYKREIDSKQKTAWSNLSSTEYFEIYYKIASYYVEGLLIEEEFMIWKEEKEKRTRKELCNRLNIIPTEGFKSVMDALVAQYQLDIMPGMQMSVDADLSAGKISVDEAKEQREAIVTISQILEKLDDIVI